MTRPPLIVTVYNRFSHFKNCINSLLSCNGAKDTVVFISSDAPLVDEHRRDVDNVRNYISDIRGFKKVIPIFYQNNVGSSVAFERIFELVFKDFDRLIFMEDDIVVAPNFLDYINDGLKFYENDSKIFSISAFSHSIFFEVPERNKNKVYFTHRFNPWGFGLWRDRYENAKTTNLNSLGQYLCDKKFIHKLNKVGKDRWPQFKFLVRNNINIPNDYRNGIFMLANDLYSVTPYTPKSFNLGNDGSGEHSAKNVRFDLDLSFLDKSSAYFFEEFNEEGVDNTFHFRFFNTRRHYYKTFLTKLGLYDIAYRMNKNFQK